MRKSPFLWILVAAVAGSDCTCSDELGSAFGAIGLELCDRGAACGCEVLATSSVIDFGSPVVGQSSRRTITVHNENQPRRLVIERVELGSADGVFTLVGALRRSSSAEDADVESHDFATQGQLVLEDTQEAQLILAFSPTSADSVSGTATVVSNSGSLPRWDLTLRGGAGSGTVCAPGNDCGDGSLIDFGTHNDGDIGFDAQAGLPIALGTEQLTIENGGESDLFVAVELSNDGIPETRPGELVGETGVFFLGEAGCAIIPPGQSLNIPVEYRPSSAGEHHGEVIVAGLGAPIRVELLGRVVGAHICFRTEDELPDDNVVQFGDPPSYVVAANNTETRRLWVRNCGYQQDLNITGASFGPGSDGDFSTASLPWAAQVLSPNQEVEIPFLFTPGSVSGTSRDANFQLVNDSRANPAIGILRAGIGEPERCILVGTPSPVDFDWVATDEAQQGTECPPPPLPCVGADPKISRRRELVLVNAGQRACTNIQFGAIIPDPASANMFSIETNPNPAGFTLDPGQMSQTIGLLFVRSPTQTPNDHFAKLPYTSPDMLVSPVDHILRARAGGTPDCALSFTPSTPPGAFCPNESLVFGNVNVGQERTIDLKVTNSGSDTCTITNVALAGTNSGVFSFISPTTPAVLPVGEFTTMPVTFRPVPSSSDFEELPFGCGFSIPIFGGGGDMLRFTYFSGTNGSGQQKDLALSGKGTRPDIDVIPGEVDFGDVTVGCCSATQRVAIYNGGDGTLSISSVAVSGASDAGFTNTQPADLELAPGENTEFTIQFCATSLGAASGTVEILSTDDNEERFTVSVGANGVTDSDGDDAYQQPLKPQVDVLFVVDDSGSMSDEQQNLANNFDTFIASATTLDVEYHLGVVSTDVESEWSGRLFACNDSRRFIRWSAPQNQQRDDFRCNVKTADFSRPHSDSKEAALQAGRMAFEYPNLDDFNVGFYREAATLYVIMVTDEVDQSDGTAQQYVDWFRNFKGIGNTDLLNLSAITGPPPNGCDTAAGNQKGYDAVQMVGGQFRSICAADWSDLVTSLGLDVFNPRRQFPLSRPATASSIAVSLCDDSGGTPTNCQAVPQDGNNGWSFDATTNAVIMNGAWIPGPGEHLQITYVAICFQP